MQEQRTGLVTNELVKIPLSVVVKLDFEIGHVKTKIKDESNTMSWPLEYVYFFMVEHCTRGDVYHLD